MRLDDTPIRFSIISGKTRALHDTGSIGVFEVELEGRGLVLLKHVTHSDTLSNEIRNLGQLVRRLAHTHRIIVA